MTRLLYLLLIKGFRNGRVVEYFVLLIILLSTLYYKIFLFISLLPFFFYERINNLLWSSTNEKNYFLLISDRNKLKIIRSNKIIFFVEFNLILIGIVLILNSEKFFFSIIKSNFYFFLFFLINYFLSSIQEKLQFTIHRKLKISIIVLFGLLYFFIDSSLRWEEMFLFEMTFIISYVYFFFNPKTLF